MECRVCGSSRPEIAVDLGKQPWGNHFLTKDQVGKEPTYPLAVYHCPDCHTAQLGFTVPKETMFSDHTYRSGTTKSLTTHFDNIAKEVHGLIPCGNVVDIGSNDGTQLKAFKELGWRALGVESSVPTAAAANADGIDTINEFFNEKTAETIKEMWGPADVVNASGVFFHLEELHSVCDGIKLLLKSDGLFVVQFIYAKTMMENGAFDQIYHEHLLYYTLETIGNLLNRHALYLRDAYLAPIHGGSIIAFVSPEDGPITERLRMLAEAEKKSDCNSFSSWAHFGRRIDDMKRKNLDKLWAWKLRKKRVYGLGAPVKGSTLLNTFGITTDLIECLTERNPLRNGMFAPGSHIPIVMEDEVETPDVFYCLAWNFKKEILERNKELIAKGVEFYFPVETE